VAGKVIVFLEQIEYDLEKITFSKVFRVCILRRRYRMKTISLSSQNIVETAPGVHMQGFAGEQLMVTHLFFEAGAGPAAHSHPHEQMTIIVSGEVEFTLGEERAVLKAGDLISIPSNVVHRAVALTAVEMYDIFTPTRTDLIEKLGL
jgi:quercetin dioxygenase-like cupin family protein